MSEKEKKEKILENFEQVLPEMSEMEVENLLGFSEGVAFMKGKQKEKEGVKRE